MYRASFILRPLSALMLGLLLTIGGPAPAAPANGELNIQFHSRFWLNLHHMLYAAAYSGRRVMARPDEQVDRHFTAAERRAWEDAVAYYRAEMAPRDLRTGEGMAAIRDALIRSHGELDAQITGDLRRHLSAVADLYRERLWPAHDRANRQWIEDVGDKLRDLGPQVITQQTKALEARWIEHPAHVEIVRYGRAYTTTTPTIVTVIASSEPKNRGWAGAEITVHELTHALTGRLRARIAREASAIGFEPPLELWHAVLFYIGGEIWRQQLATRGVTYRPYAEATGLLTETWAPFAAPIRTHVLAYLEGRVNANDAYRDLVAEVARTHAAESAK